MENNPQEQEIPKAFELVERLLAMFREDGETVVFGDTPGRAVAIAHLRLSEGGELPVLVEVTQTPLLNQEQAAGLMKVSTRTLQKWSADGLPSIPYQVGGRAFPRYPLNLLQKYADRIGHRPGTLRDGEFGRRMKMIDKIQNRAWALNPGKLDEVTAFIMGPPRRQGA